MVAILDVGLMKRCHEAKEQFREPRGKMLTQLYPNAHAFRTALHDATKCPCACAICTPTIKFKLAAYGDPLPIELVALCAATPYQLLLF